MLQFVEITKENAHSLYDVSIAEYAKMQYEIGEFPSLKKAEEVSRKEVMHYIEDTRFSHKHRIYYLYKDKTHVGYLWFMVEPEYESLFLQYIHVFPQFRRKGYAMQALEYFEEKALENKVKECILVVLNNNLNAIPLYEKAGYRVAKEFSMYQSKQPTRTKLIKRLAKKYPNSMGEIEECDAIE